jgi:small ligand-binding sensory domain FIST
MIVGLGLSSRAEPIRAVMEAARAACAAVPAEQRALVVVIASGAPAASPAELATAAAELTGAPLVVSATSAGVGVGGIELEGDGVAIAVIGGVDARVAGGDGLGFDSDAATSAALRDLDLEPDGAALLWFDAMTVSPAGMIDALRRQVPAGLPLLGLGAVDRQGAPWVGVDEQPTPDAVAALWLRGVSARWSQAPMGQPLTGPLHVTRGMGGVIEELDGRRAYEVLAEAVRAPMMADLERMGRTVFVGLPGPGGVELVRPLRGVDPYAGAIAVGGAPVQPGQAIRFLLRSPEQARENLQGAIDALQAQLDQPPALLLVARAAGRGQELYGPDLAGVEAAMVASAFPDTPVLSAMSACELTPTPDGHALHLYTTLLIALT